MTGPQRYVIGKRFRFESTRKTGGTWDGHSFTVEAVLSAGCLDEVGFVVDFHDLAPLKEYISSRLDHRVLDDVMEDASDRGISRHLLRWSLRHLPAAARVRLRAVHVRPGRPAAPAGTGAVRFDATHRLARLAADHPCSHPHGHSYLVTVARYGTPATGVPAALRRRVAELDGTVLNEVLAFNPTSELLAEHLARHLPASSRPTPSVRVSETETSWAEYHRETP